MRRAGQFVTNPAGTSRKALETPASQFFTALAGLCTILGIPAAIVLTIVAGAWWVFFPAVGGMIVFGMIAESCKRKPAA